MKKDVKRKAFIKWPLYMSVVLLIMSVVVYVIDPYAGYAAIATALLYTAIAVAAYVYSRPAVHQGNDFFCHAVRTNSETAFEGIVRSLRAGR